MPPLFDSIGHDTLGVHPTGIASLRQNAGLTRHPDGRPTEGGKKQPTPQTDGSSLFCVL